LNLAGRKSDGFFAIFNTVFLDSPLDIQYICTTMTADNISLRLEILRGSHAEHWKWEKELAKFVLDPKDPRRKQARDTSNDILKRINDLTK